MSNDEQALVFLVAMGGREPGEFGSLVDAMGYAESFDAPTGGIFYSGDAIIQYRNGGIALAQVSEN
jgi:hypothetical protein